MDLLYLTHSQEMEGHFKYQLQLFKGADPDIEASTIGRRERNK